MKKICIDEIKEIAEAWGLDESQLKVLEDNSNTSAVTEIVANYMSYDTTNDDAAWVLSHTFYEDCLQVTTFLEALEKGICRDEILEKYTNENYKKYKVEREKKIRRAGL